MCLFIGLGSLFHLLKCLTSVVQMTISLQRGIMTVSPTATPCDPRFWQDRTTIIIIASNKIRPRGYHARPRLQATVQQSNHIIRSLESTTYSLEVDFSCIRYTCLHLHLLKIYLFKLISIICYKAGVWQLLCLLLMIPTWQKQKNKKNNKI